MDDDTPHLDEAATRPRRRASWQRHRTGEPRWPMAAGLAVVIAVQLFVPDQIQVGPGWVIPLVEAVLLVAVVAVDPGRIDNVARRSRVLSLVLTGVMLVANLAMAGLLVHQVIDGEIGQSAGPLFATSAAVLVASNIAFGMLYWQLDRGGPARRAAGTDAPPDFAFPQMLSPELAAPDWRPEYPDYLYLSFTNLMALSPTDVMPLARWAKLAMAVQAMLAVGVLVVVVSRAINAM